MGAIASPDPEQLRRATLACAGACAALAAVLLATFWVLLSPQPSDHCNTSLLPSTFRSALAPLHLVGALVLSLCVSAIEAARRGRRLPGAVTLLVLGALWIFLGACWARPDLFSLAGFVGVFGGPLVGIPGLIALALRTLLVSRSREPGAEHWRRHAGSVQFLLWGCLLLGLPASISYAWMRGASPLCF